MQPVRGILEDEHAAHGDAVLVFVPVPDLEAALRSIVSLYPEPGMCAELVPKWIGPNDGAMRAAMLWQALNTARVALGMATYPEPDPWKKGEN